MIAPLRTEPKHRSVISRQLVAARSMVAAMFLPSKESSPAPPIARWRAWLFVAWVSLVMAVYALSMAGFLNPEP